MFQETAAQRWAERHSKLLRRWRKGNRSAALIRAAAKEVRQQKGHPGKATYGAWMVLWLWRDEADEAREAQLEAWSCATNNAFGGAPLAPVVHLGDRRQERATRETDEHLYGSAG